jgi:hypothetical protein
MTPAKPLSEMVGKHFITKTRAITTRYGQGNVLVMSDGSECFGNTAINKWLEIYGGMERTKMAVQTYTVSIKLY